MDRAQEILKWLSQAKLPLRAWVALDDLDLHGWCPELISEEHFELTDDAVGLSNANVESAIAKLHRQLADAQGGGSRCDLGTTLRAVLRLSDPHLCHPHTCPLPGLPPRRTKCLAPLWRTALPVYSRYGHYRDPTISLHTSLTQLTRFSPHAKFFPQMPRVLSYALMLSGLGECPKGYPKWLHRTSR